MLECWHLQGFDIPSAQRDTMQSCWDVLAATRQGYHHLLDLAVLVHEEWGHLAGLQAAISEDCKQDGSCTVSTVEACVQAVLI